MKDDSTDQLILLAQMAAEDSPTFSKHNLNSLYPLAFIIIAGITCTIIGIIFAQKWESHINKSFIENDEKKYLNTVQHQLSLLSKNVDMIIALSSASTYVSDDEFKVFSKQLFTDQPSSSFSAILSSSEHKSSTEYWYVAEASPNKPTHISRSPKEKDNIKKLADTTKKSDNHFITTSFHDQKSIVFIAHQSIGTDNSPVLILSGMAIEDIFFNDQPATEFQFKISDGINPPVYFNSSEKDFSSEEHEQSKIIKNLSITIRHVKHASGLEGFQSLQWILIGFSLFFTALLCAQFIYARRSVQKLAKLAVQRANDLTAINSDLTDEIMSRIQFQAELLDRTNEIQIANRKLEDVQNQLLQQEKLASLGQMAAGVAHEINNPVGFINSNLSMLEKYSERSIALFDLLDKIESKVDDETISNEIASTKKKCKYNNLRKNLQSIIAESQEGVERVKRIVNDLKNFSRVDEAEWQWVDLHSGIDSTLNIAWNEIKYKAEVHKHYGNLPAIECVPSQLNQVFMNLLVNAAQAIKESGNIYIRSKCVDEHVIIEIEDDGDGIPKDIIGKIFDPFFTTKEVGKGTGLGLSLSYGIIKKHQGDLNVESVKGKGTIFTITLPIKQPMPDKNNEAA
jgi:signal transduction histidine kinase